jgi:hypothetical protein
VKLFLCQACKLALMFENTDCERCGHRLGYLPDRQILSAVEPCGGNWIAVATPDGRYRFCKNWEQRGCNWMVPADSANALCAACCHNRTIPDITDPTNHRRWQKVEAAKRRLIYSLIKLRLPLPTVASGEREPLVFDILSDVSPGEKAVTGHDSGVITISLSEADDATREQNRVSMGEAYRTLLGHFRHEVGHYYWNKLVRDGGQIESCRAVFGDDRLVNSPDMILSFSHMMLKSRLKICVGAFVDHRWQRFQYLLLGVVNIPKSVDEEVIHRLDIPREETHGFTSVAGRVVAAAGRERSFLPALSIQRLCDPPPLRPASLAHSGSLAKFPPDE